MFRTVSAILLAAYAVFLAAHFAAVPAGSDSSGYFNTARLLAEGRLATPLRGIEGFAASSPWVFTPHGFTPEGAQPGLTPTYPTGLPLHYAAGAALLGWHWGPLAVAVLASVATVLLTFLILRELGIGRELAVAGAAAIAVSPLFLFVSFIPMSDVPTTAWLALAVLGALRARNSVGWAVTAGLAFSVAVVIRPTTVVLAPAFALLLGGLRPIAWAGIGAIPGAAWQAFTGIVLYGGVLRTGYGAFGDSFGWAYLVPSWRNYVMTFPSVLPLALVAALLVPWWPWRRRIREWLALGLLAAGLLLFYSFYNVTKDVWWYLRFVLPVFPVLIALALVWVQGFLEYRKIFTDVGRKAWIVPALVIAASLVPSVLWSRKQHVLMMKSFQEPYAAAGEWARANLPKGSAVAAMHLSGTLYFYTDSPIVRWDLISAGDVAALSRTLTASGRSLYAMVHPFEGDADLRAHFPWRWEKVAEVEGVVVLRSGGESR
jgi:hypothetical protein